MFTSTMFRASAGPLFGKLHGSSMIGTTDSTAPRAYSSVRIS
jgi:hypothetical protein